MQMALLSFKVRKIWFAGQHHGRLRLVQTDSRWNELVLCQSFILYKKCILPSATAAWNLSTKGPAVQSGEHKRHFLHLPFLKHAWKLHENDFLASSLSLCVHTFTKLNINDLESTMKLFANACFHYFGWHFMSCEWQSIGCATTPHAYIQSTQYVSCVCVCLSCAWMP